MKFPTEYICSIFYVLKITEMAPFCNLILDHQIIFLVKVCAINLTDKKCER